MISRNDPCFCGSGKKWKKCHYPELPRNLRQEYMQKYQIYLKTEEEIAGIKRACKLTANILKEACAFAKEGVTTNAINDLVMERTISAGAQAAPLNYGHPPYPKAICTSLNEVICHGIPNDEPLKSGDIMNIDVSCILDGYFGDCSAMVMIGDVPEEKKRVVKTAYDALMESIKICKPGAKLHQIGDVIEKIAAENHCSVVDAFVGHGVGLEFHENPQVPHHKNRNALELVEGMTFTIELMINIGKKGAVIDESDGWTARTVDGKPSAQWEHTILITEQGPEILTIPD